MNTVFVIEPFKDSIDSTLIVQFNGLQVNSRNARGYHFVGAGATNQMTICDCLADHSVQTALYNQKVAHATEFFVAGSY